MQLHPCRAAALALVLGSGLIPVQAAQEIAPEQFKKLHALIKPQAHEWKLMEIEWMPNLWEARKRAAAEDKPIFAWTEVASPLVMS